MRINVQHDCWNHLLFLSSRSFSGFRGLESFSIVKLCLVKFFLLLLMVIRLQNSWSIFWQASSKFPILGKSISWWKHEKNYQFQFLSLDLIKVILFLVYHVCYFISFNSIPVSIIFASETFSSHHINQFTPLYDMWDFLCPSFACYLVL